MIEDNDHRLRWIQKIRKVDFVQDKNIDARCPSNKKIWI